MTINELLNGHATAIYPHSTEGDIFRIARHCHDDCKKNKLIIEDIKVYNALVKYWKERYNKEN